MIEAYLAHHGVKGQKWGIRKKSHIRPSGIGRRSRRGNVLAYTKTNRFGSERQKSYRISRVERGALKRAGVIDRDGSITTQKQQQAARKYCETMKHVKFTAGVLGTAAIAGKIYFDTKSRKAGG